MLWMTCFTEYHNFRPLFQVHKILEQSRMNTNANQSRRDGPTILKAFQNNDNLKLLARKVFERHTKQTLTEKSIKLKHYWISWGMFLFDCINSQWNTSEALAQTTAQSPDSETADTELMKMSNEKSQCCALIFFSPYFSIEAVDGHT